MRCVVCDQRKAKRSCPAKSASICAPCCGEKRVLEIDCPETCRYLEMGRSHEVKEYFRYLRSTEPGKAEARERIVSENEAVIAHIEAALAQERLAVHDLTDGAVAEALDLLLDAYRTEEKGILYEKTSSDLQVDSLRRTLREIIQSRRNPEGGGTEGLVGSKEKRLLLKPAIESLEFVRDVVACHIGAGASPTSYVNLLARIIPRGRPSDDKRHSIIIP
jgi:hypothetical protein